MSVKLYEAPTANAFQTTLDGSIDDAETTISLTSTTNLVAPGVLVIDRQDGSGNDTPTKREYITFTGISSNDLTGVTREVGGSTAQAHSSGALVEATVSVTHWNDMVDFMQVEHTSAGKHVISTATINYAELKQMALTSTASLAQAHLADVLISTHLYASGASVSGRGIGIFPTFVMPLNASAATTNFGKPLSIPREGTARYVSVTLRAPVSAASLIFDVNKNFVSMFDTGTRPSILGGGTFVSTASLSIPAIAESDILSVDLDAGGEYSDATLIVGIY